MAARMEVGLLLHISMVREKEIQGTRAGAKAEVS